MRAIRARLDRFDLGHGEGFSLACLLDLNEVGDAQPRDVGGRAVVAVGVVATVGAPEPAAPLDRFDAMVRPRRAVGGRAFATGGARVRRPTRAFRTEAQTQQMALVA